MDFDTDVIIAIYCLVGGVFLMIFTGNLSSLKAYFKITPIFFYLKILAVMCRRYSRNSWDSLPKAKQARKKKYKKSENMHALKLNFFSAYNNNWPVPSTRKSSVSRCSRQVKN